MTLATRSIDVPTGTPIDQVDTPALLLDLDRFERNADRLMEVMRANGVGWRPHSKAHKSPDIAQRQQAIGAHGVTCAKVSEAEVMVDGGIGSILIANELPLPGKWQRVAALQDRAEVMAAADAPEHVAMASEAGAAASATIPLVIEVDIGMERSGIAPGQPTVDLARRIAASPGVRLAGIMGYEGHTLTDWPLDVKKTTVHAALRLLVDTARQIEAAGIPVPIVSAGGSGTFMFAATFPGVTELQAGGACLMDRFYAEECHLEDLGFEHALTVAASVSARPAPDRAIADSGFKTMSQRNEMKPRPLDMPDVEVIYLSAEHANLRLGPAAPDLRIGDRITFIPEYSDTTTLLHDAFVAHRNGRVEGVI